MGFNTIMGAIERFFEKILQPQLASSFANLSDDEFETHMQKDRYGEFLLTDAIRPSYDLQIVPSTGYRHETWQYKKSGGEIPVIIAAATRGQLMNLFLDLLDPLGEKLDVVLETSHHRTSKGHDDLYREDIDPIVLRSNLYEFEDVILDDGYTGIVVRNDDLDREVQFDDHKLLYVYGHNLAPFEEILHQHRIKCRENIKFITDAEHIHNTTDELTERFQQLKCALGLDDEEAEDDDPFAESF